MYLKYLSLCSKSLTGMLQLLIALSVHKSQILLHKLDVNLLGGPNTETKVYKPLSIICKSRNHMLSICNELDTHILYKATSGLIILVHWYVWPRTECGHDQPNSNDLYKCLTFSRIQLLTIIVCRH